MGQVIYSAVSRDHGFFNERPFSLFVNQIPYASFIGKSPIKGFEPGQGYALLYRILPADHLSDDSGAVDLTCFVQHTPDGSRVVVSVSGDREGELECLLLEAQRSYLASKPVKRIDVTTLPTANMMPAQRQEYLFGRIREARTQSNVEVIFLDGRLETGVIAYDARSGKGRVIDAERKVARPFSFSELAEIRW